VDKKSQCFISRQDCGAQPRWDRANEYSGPAQNPKYPGNDPLPWANPANIAFNNKTQSLLVTNHASLTGLRDPSPLFAVFDGLRERQSREVVQRRGRQLSEPFGAGRQV
jgi:hypothetical protein